MVDFREGGHGDHGGVVACETRVGEMKYKKRLRRLFRFGPQQTVGADAAGEGDGLSVGVLFEGEGEFFEEDVDGGLFERGGEVGDLFWGE